MNAFEVREQADAAFGAENFNERLSSHDEARYGRHGAVAVKLEGEKAGVYFDHATGHGGRIGKPVAFDFRIKGIGPPSRTWDYEYADGRLAGKVGRYKTANGKTVRCWVPDTTDRSGWICTKMPTPSPLYRLRQLLADPSAYVVVVEGEPACDAAQKLLGPNFVCVTWAGGASRWQEADWTHISDRYLILWADADSDGKTAMEGIAGFVYARAASVHVVDVSDLPPKADAADVQWNSDELLRRCSIFEPATSTNNDVQALAPGTTAASFWPLMRALQRGGETKAEQDQFPCILDICTLAQTEPVTPRFILNQWWPQGEVTLFSGHGGSGKSSVALMLAVCVALGRPFCGITTVQRAVTFFALEDNADILHWRLARVCSWLGIDMASLGGRLTLIDGARVDSAMMVETPDGLVITPVFTWLKQRISEDRASVLIIDGGSDAFDGNENVRRAVRRFVRSLRTLVPADGAVLLIAHVDKQTAKNGDSTQQAYSGSTAWHNSVRARWYLYEVDDGLVVELQKSNHGPKGGQLRLAWNPSAHLFVGDVAMPTTQLERDLAESDERAQLLTLIERVQHTDPVPSASAGPRTTYHVLSASEDFPKTLTTKEGKARFWRHLEKLRSSGMVKATAVTDKHRHRVSVLVRASS